MLFYITSWDTAFEMGAEKVLSSSLTMRASLKLLCDFGPPAVEVPFQNEKLLLLCQLLRPVKPCTVYQNHGSFFWSTVYVREVF